MHYVKLFTDARAYYSQVANFTIQYTIITITEDQLVQISAAGTFTARAITTQNMLVAI